MPYQNWSLYNIVASPHPWILLLLCVSSYRYPKLMLMPTLLDFTLNRDLQVVVWNAYGLKNRVNEFSEFEGHVKLGVSSAKRTCQRTAGKSYYPGTCLQGRQTIQTGEGIYYSGHKTLISQGHVHLHSREHIEATAVELHGALGGLLVVSAYKPPQKDLLNTDLSAIIGVHRRVIIAGDLNSKHTACGWWRTHRSGGLLAGSLNAGWSMHQPSPPTIRSVLIDIVDIAVTKEVVCPIQVDTRTELSSDHCIILFHAYICGGSFYQAGK